MKKLTINLGANKERDSIRAKVKRDRKSWAVCKSANEYQDYLLRWIDQRNERYAKRPGTLKGRK